MGKRPWRLPDHVDSAWTPGARSLALPYAPSPATWSIAADPVASPPPEAPPPPPSRSPRHPSSLPVPSAVHRPSTVHRHRPRSAPPSAVCGLRHPHSFIRSSFVDGLPSPQQPRKPILRCLPSAVPPPSAVRHIRSFVPHSLTVCPPPEQPRKPILRCHAVRHPHSFIRSPFVHGLPPPASKAHPPPPPRSAVRHPHSFIRSSFVDGLPSARLESPPSAACRPPSAVRRLSCRPPSIIPPPPPAAPHLAASRPLHRQDNTPGSGCGAGTLKPGGQGAHQGEQKLQSLDKGRSRLPDLSCCQ
jgi:hypothetical protein